MIPHQINSSCNATTTFNNGVATELNPSSASAASSSATFHDFMGMSFAPGASDSPLGKSSAEVVRLLEFSPTGSASVGGSSVGGGCRGCPISTTSDLGSVMVERQGGNHFEGVRYYGSRSDLSGAEVSNRITGSKRSNSDSTFMGSSRNGIAQIRPVNNVCMMKEQSRRSNDEDHYFGMQALRPNSASLMLQPPNGNRPDANISKWDRHIPMNMNPVVQYLPRGVQFSLSMHQVPPNRFRDSNARGSSVISQSAADEGSRTDIKGSGSGVLERNPPGGLPTANRPSFGIHTLEPESTLGSRQMTIFYGGQAHVFDEVHPNKADVIMALAGSNGGSWSTTYSPKSNSKPIGETHIRIGENETGPASNITFLRELRGRSTLIGHSSPGYTSGDRISSTICNPLSGGIVGNDTRNTIEEAEPSTAEEKREIAKEYARF